jgi:hypothetical protein
MYLLSFSKEARTFDSPSIEEIGDILCLLFYLQNILTFLISSFNSIVSNPTPPLATKVAQSTIDKGELVNNKIKLN